MGVKDNARCMMLFCLMSVVELDRYLLLKLMRMLFCYKERLKGSGPGRVA